MLLLYDMFLRNISTANSREGTPTKSKRKDTNKDQEKSTISSPIHLPASYYSIIYTLGGEGAHLIQNDGPAVFQA